MRMRVLPAAICALAVGVAGAAPTKEASMSWLEKTIATSAGMYAEEPYAGGKAIQSWKWEWHSPKAANCELSYVVRMTKTWATGQCSVDVNVHASFAELDVGTIRTAPEPKIPGASSFAISPRGGRSIGFKVSGTCGGEIPQIPNQTVWFMFRDKDMPGRVAEAFRNLTAQCPREPH